MTSARIVKNQERKQLLRHQFWGTTILIVAVATLGTTTHPWRFGNLLRVY
jgi:hypothetical protein